MDPVARSAADFRQKIGRALQRVKDDYRSAYFNLHKKARLGANEDGKKKELMKDPRLESLKKLAGVSLLSHSTLSELQIRLAKVQTCFTLVKDDLDASAICPHCNFRPQEENLGASGAAVLDQIDQQLDDLRENWTKTLLDNLDDPTARKSIKLLPEAQKEAVNAFLKGKKLPEKINNDLVQGIQTGVIRPVAIPVKPADLLDALSDGSAPCTVDQIRTRFEEFVQKITRGKEPSKVRLVIDRGETPGATVTTHLSTRLVWHDRAWDGHICDHPSKNTSCVVQQHIRDGRDEDREDEAAGMILAELDGWQPPCSRDTIAFSSSGYTITHNDPLEFRQLPSVKEGLPPYSVCPSPYRWMREENFRTICEDEKLDIRASDQKDKEFGWVFEPDRQIELLRNFWGKLEKGSSLIFFYCNHGNPLDESLNRILLGVSRISDWPTAVLWDQATKVPGPISHLVPVHHPRFSEPGLSTPLSRVHQCRSRPEEHSLPCPRRGDAELLLRCRTSRRRSGGTALERLVQSIQAVKDDGKVPGDWDRHLVWLNDVLSEVWQNRGPFPGIGSVLQYLGCDSGTAFQRQFSSRCSTGGRMPGSMSSPPRRPEEVRPEAVRQGAEASR